MADIKIDQELVRSLLEDQHPDLAGRILLDTADDIFRTFSDQILPVDEGAAKQ